MFDSINTLNFQVLAAICPETPKKPHWILEHRMFCVRKYWQFGSFKAAHCTGGFPDEFWDGQVSCQERHTALDQEL